MSRYLLIYLLFSQLPAPQAQSAKWAPVETTTFHWLTGGSPYTLILEESTSEDAADVRLRIKVPGRRDFTLSVPGGIVKLTEGPLDQKLVADNLLKSAYLYLTPKLKGIAGRPMLVVFGWAYGSDPGSLHVLSLDQTGYPVDVFSSDTFELEALTDLDGDATSEIVGVHCLSQLFGTCFSTYDPYSVYRLPRSGVGKTTLSLALSRKYNLKHYYGWAGPDCREDTVIILCAPKGKPRIMSATEAKRLYRK